MNVGGINKKMDLDHEAGVGSKEGGCRKDSH